jgi:hypothetical protein
MTVHVARRARRRVATLAAPALAPSDPIFKPTEPIAIGELDQTIFDCPSCGRPLALGARRCSGCRTRLVNGVTLRKSSLFVAGGLAVGIGLSAAAGFIAGGRPSAAPGGPIAAAAGASNASTPPKSSTAPTVASASPTSASGAVPPVTRSALIQVVGVNDRLAAAAGELRAALDAPTFRASDVAQTLRAMSADAVFGEQVAIHVSEWSGTSAVGDRLLTFYGAVHDAAASGFVASVQNAAAYRAATRTMLRLLDGMPALDDAVGLAALGAGVTLPAPAD